MRAVDWGFNGYGGLVNGIYFPWDQDDLIASKMCAIEGVDRYRIGDFILEGGSVHSDGEGTILTTEETLLDPDATRISLKNKLRNSSKNILAQRKFSGSRRVSTWTKIRTVMLTISANGSVSQGHACLGR